MTDGHLAEVFLSFQGEGTHVGRAHLFLRLGGCPLRCRYCDTPQALVAPERFRVRAPQVTEPWRDNPVSAATAAALLDEVDPDGIARDIALTGGEPLAQPEFLAELLPRRGPRSVYLETAGVHPEALDRILEHVRTVAMDIKLPSVSGERDLFEEHGRFLEVAARREVLVKLVVSEALDLSELEAAARLVGGFSRDIPFVLQPQTDRKSGRPASGAFLMEAYRAARRCLEDVRIIPQTHRFLGID